MASGLLTSDMSALLLLLGLQVYAQTGADLDEVVVAEGVRGHWDEAVGT